MPYRPTAADAGVYRFVKKLWDEEDVGHLFLVREGQHATPLTNRQQGFSFYPELVFEGHLVKVKESDEILKLIEERDVLQRKIDEHIERLAPKFYEPWLPEDD